MLYKVKLRSGGKAYIYTLIEHKSNPDEFTPLQLLRYMIRIWKTDRRKKEPLRPIIPIVLYHGREPWRAPTNFSGMFNVSDRKATLVAGETATIWLGLGQIKHLRRQSVARLVEQRPFTSLPDLLDRVPLQAKEIRHLIQCGAADGWGSSRAGLLAQAEAILRAGSGRQMVFGFAVAEDVVAETAVQRFEWEMALLGMPVSVNPLPLSPSLTTLPVRQLPERVNQRVTLSGFCLPGWTGGKGWFLSDGDSFVIVRGGKRPSAWEHVMINGRYRVDVWGGGWFQA